MTDDPMTSSQTWITSPYIQPCSIVLPDDEQHTQTEVGAELFLPVDGVCGCCCCCYISCGYINTSLSFEQSGVCVSRQHHGFNTSLILSL